MSEPIIQTHKVKCTWLSGMKHGWGCGYVGVPKNHPWWGLDYDDVQVDIHGGLTYGRNKHPEADEQTPTDFWWFGFDTAHFGDNLETCPESYVDSEIESLKQQALAAFTHAN
jgi:hypothetical protein